MKTSRNDPCPCGSGSKYKNCHLEKDNAAHAAHRPGTRSPLHELDNRVTRDIIQFIADRQPADLEDAIDAIDSYPQITPDLSVAWLAWVEWFDGRTAASAYLEAREPSLPRRTVDWIKSQVHEPFSIWQVREVEPGRSVTLLDFLTAEVRTIEDVLLSKSIEPLYFIMARIVEHEGTSVLCGIHPVPMRPIDGMQIVQAFRKKARRRAFNRAQLLDLRIARKMLTVWSDAVDRLSMPPELRNNDGDDILLTADRWRVDAASREEVRRRLLTMDGAVDDDASIAILRDEDQVVLGFLRFEPEKMTPRSANLLLAETNSVERADALRAKIEAACGDLLTSHFRSHTDPVSAFPKPGEPPRPLPEPETSTEGNLMVREMKERHYADWADQPLPLLEGKTPREGMRTKRGREVLTILLEEMERREALLPLDARFDANILRRKLGL